MGKWLSNRSSSQKSTRIMQMAIRPMTKPIRAKSHNSCMFFTAKAGVGKSGAQPLKWTATAVATEEEMATGMKDRARNSKRSNSMATSIPAKGATKVAAIPAAAPEASRTRRWYGVSFTTWARIEPNAAPVCMIGPSAPNGPPVPMAKAVASGFKIPTRILTRLFPISTASMASGIPWPFRVGSQKWTMMPTTRPPMGGMRITHAPR